MPFAVAGAAIGAGASIYAASKQSDAIKSGQDSANAAQLQALQLERGDLAPFRTAGENALLRAGNLAGANGPDAATAAMGDFYTSPGYDFRLKEGLRAVDAGASANGILHSGATIKAEQAYGQGLASSEFDKYYNRLFGLSQLGENAAAQTGSGAITTGQGIAQTDASAANKTADIYGNLGKGLSTTVNGLFSNPKVVDWLGGGSGSGAVDTTSTF